MKDHNGVLMMQRALLAGTLGLAMAQKAAAILEGEPNQRDPGLPVPGAGPDDVASPYAPTSPYDPVTPYDPMTPYDPVTPDDQRAEGQQDRVPRSQDAAVLRAILDAANECLGHFDDRPPGERWCDALFHLLDLAAFATEIGGG